MTPITRIDITARSMIRLLCIVVAVWFLYLVRDVLLMVFAAALIATAIEPLANHLQKWHIPRALTILGVYLLLLFIVSATVTLVIPPLTQEITHLSTALPQIVDAVGKFSHTSVVTTVQRSLVQLSQDAASISLNVVAQTSSIVGGIATIIFVFILAFYLVVERTALTTLFHLIIPHEHRVYSQQVLEQVQHAVGRWMLAQLSLALIVGFTTGIGLYVIGVPYALVLGLLMGLFEVVPVIGPILGAVPGVLVGFSQSFWLGIGTLVIYILVQQAEAHFLVPTIMRKATGLNPLITLIAVLLGARLAGLVGVLLAVPLALILSIFWTDFFHNHDRLARPPEGPAV